MKKKAMWALLAVIIMGVATAAIAIGVTSSNKKNVIDLDSRNEPQVVITTQFEEPSKIASLLSASPDETIYPEEPPQTTVYPEEPPQATVYPEEPPQATVYPEEPPRSIVYPDDASEYVIYYEESPYTKLATDESYAKRFAGFYIRRDNELSIVDRFSWERGLTGNFGDRQYGSGGNAGIEIYVEEMGYYVSLGDVPMASLKYSDDLISFGATVATLTEAEFRGYTIPIVSHKIGAWDIERRVYANFDDGPIKLSKSAWDSLEVVGEDGRLIEDIRDIPYGEVCTVGWFEGVQYNEIRMTANCRYFEIIEEGARYDLDYTLSKESYASFDFSDVPAGTYLLTGGRTCFIEVG